MLLARPTVLVIEDNEDSRVIMSVWLEHAGYHVVLAGDAPMGLELARILAPDVILMDVALPGMDGWTAAGALRADPATATIPIIAVTAMAMPHDECRAREVGVSEYLSKPVTLARLLESIRRVVGDDAAPIAPDIDSAADAPVGNAAPDD
jgi:CheY-like chemotaxis protein